MTDVTFDTPENEEVLQEDERPLDAIPVVFDGVLRTEEMPCKEAAFRNIVLRAGADPVAIMQENPRRKRAVIWPCINLDTEAVLVCLAATYGDCMSFNGALLASGAQAIARYEITYSGQLWARACVINDSSGIYTGIAVSTDDIVLSVVTEDWAQ